MNFTARRCVVFAGWQIPNHDDDFAGSSVTIDDEVANRVGEPRIAVSSRRLYQISCASSPIVISVGYRLTSVLFCAKHLGLLDGTRSRFPFSFRYRVPPAGIFLQRTFDTSDTRDTVPRDRSRARMTSAIWAALDR